MTEPQIPPRRSPSSPTLKLIGLTVIIIVAICAYTAGWFYMSGRLQSEVSSEIAQISKRTGERASCDNLAVRGFPFRLGLFCDTVLYENALSGLAASAGAFRSAAQVYDPRTVVGEVDGPGRLQLPGLPTVDLAWKDLRFSGELDKPQPRAVSLDANELRIGEVGGSSIASLANAQFHSRLREGDLDLALSARNIDLTLDGLPDLPELTSEIDATVEDGASLLRDEQVSLRGRSGTLRSLSLTDASGDAGLSLSGPFSVSEEGLLNGDFSIGIDDAQRTAEILAAIFPDAADSIRSALSALGSMNGGSIPSIPLTVRDGRPSILFISFDRLPPLI